MSWQDELAALARDLGDRLTPAAVIEYARNPATALHQEIEWNDEAAGDAFRLLQARTLIRRVVVKMDRGAGNRSVHVRAYLNVERGSGEYRSLHVVRGDHVATAAIIAQLLADLRSVQTRLIEYGHALEATPELLETISDFLGRNAAKSTSAA